MRAHRGRHAVEQHEAVLRLGNNLLRDGDDVSVFEREAVRGNGLRNEQPEVVAGTNGADAFEADELKPGCVAQSARLPAQAMPVIASPASGIL